jgi:hypothetical protein
MLAEFCKVYIAKKLGIQLKLSITKCQTSKIKPKSYKQATPYENIWHLFKLHFALWILALHQKK